MGMKWLPLWLQQKGAKNTHLSKDKTEQGVCCVRGNKNAKEVWAEQSTKTLEGGAISKTDTVPRRRVMLSRPGGIKDNIFNHLCTKNINRFLKLIICTLVLLDLLRAFNNSCPKITKMVSSDYSICFFKMNSNPATLIKGESTKAPFSAPTLCLSMKGDFSFFKQH